MGNICCKDDKPEPNIEIKIKDVYMCDNISCLSTCCIRKKHTPHKHHHKHKNEINL